jgi:biopolymer transport protein ExbB
MSVITWVVIIHKLIDQYYQRRLARKVDSFWHTMTLDQGMLALAPSSRNHFYTLAKRGQEALLHILNSRQVNTNSSPPQLHDRLNISDWVTRGLQQSIDTSAASMHSGLALLGSIGSTAPFIGLFGTVWGIYHALIGLSHPQGSKTNTSIELVAGPIGEALIMTALGLAVAIPAVLAYNALMRGNKAIVSSLNRFAHDLHAYFVTGTRVDQGED